MPRLSAALVASPLRALRAAIPLALIIVTSVAAPAVAHESIDPPMPLGSVAQWFSGDNYPPSAMRAGQEGNVSAILSINAQGMVTGCQVTSSSGVPALDVQTCLLATRWGHFTPAKQGNQAVASTYSLRKIEWRLRDMSAHVPSSIPESAANAPVSNKPPITVQCQIDKPWTCVDTNKLVWAKGFNDTVSQFLGKDAARRVNLLYPGQLRYQLADALGGPPDDRLNLSDGSYLFTACRPHSCTEKGAIAFDARGSITAIAIVNFRCGRVSYTCSNDPFLDVYTRNLSTESLPIRRIVEWADRETASDAKVFHDKAVTAPIIHKLAT